MYLDGNMRLFKQHTYTYTSPTQQDSYSFSLDDPTFDGWIQQANNSSGLQEVKDEALNKAGFTFVDYAYGEDSSGDTSWGYFLKTLSTSQTKNPDASVNTNNVGYAQNENIGNNLMGVSSAYSEVQAMQTGFLAFAPSEAKYSYVLDEEAELPIWMTSKENGTDVTGYKKVKVPVGTLVIVCEELNENDDNDKDKAATIGTNGQLVPDDAEVTITSSSGATHMYTSTVYVKTQEYDLSSDEYFVPQRIEAESFTPMTDGLYLFLRNEEPYFDSDSPMNNHFVYEPEFSGYCLNGYDDTDKYDNANFFALSPGDGNKSDYTVKGQLQSNQIMDTYPVGVIYEDPYGAETQHNISGVVPSPTLGLYRAYYNNVPSDKLNWYYDSTSGKERIIAVYDENKNTSFNEDDDVAVIINLANVGNGAEQWKAINGSTEEATISNIKDYGENNNPNISATKLKTSDVLKFYYNNDLC